jgi:amidohydrolase
MDLKKKIAAVMTRVHELRWQIHQYPELSLCEEQTAVLVERELIDIGLVPQRVTDTGVVAVLSGGQPGKTIALRADMDALPLPEKTGSPYSSRVDGVMHACGHDVHTAILLGVARLLMSVREQLAGNVKFIFQPAEENNPVGGAKLMIDAGVLDNPKVEMVLGLHVWPDLPVGKIGIRPDAMMAASDRVFIRIKGRNSHGSAPHQGIDAVVASAYTLTALQSVVSRNVNPLEAAVLTFGTVKGGHRYNIIADEVELEGTCRTLDPLVRQLAEQRILALTNQVAAGFGTQAEARYVRGYPALINSLEGYALVRQAGEETLGKQGVIIPPYPAMGAEDLAFFLERVFGGFFWLGCTKAGDPVVPLHNPGFLPAEECLAVGVEVLSRAVINYLT